jgi:hypothetical protein
MIDLGPPALYLTAVVFGTIVAATAGVVEFARDHGVTRIRGVFR